MGVEKLMNAAGLFVCHPTESSDLYVSAFRKNEAWLSRLVTALAARLSNVEVTRVGFNALPEGAQWTRSRSFLAQTCWCDAMIHIAS